MIKILTIVILSGILSLTQFALAKNEKYQSLIVDTKYRQSYEKVLGRECVQGIIDLYSAGKDLSSIYVRTKAVSISSYSKKLSSGYPLYHYTDSDFLYDQFLPKISERSKVHEVLKNQSTAFSYSDLLLFQRTRGARGEDLWMTGWGNMENTVLYIATNPYTSSSYGKNLITLWVDENALVLPYEIAVENETSLRLNIIKNDKKFSKFIRKCKSGINLIIFEESGIDIVDYMSGISHEASLAGWFYLLNTKNIIGNDVIQMKEKSSTISSDKEKDVIRVNGYLEEHSRADEISQ
jgi:hypothetical protein